MIFKNFVSIITSSGLCLSFSVLKILVLKVGVSVQCVYVNIRIKLRVLELNIARRQNIGPSNDNLSLHSNFPPVQHLTSRPPENLTH